MKYYLFRHGETNWNVEGRVKGQKEDLQTSFTTKGLVQIEAVGNYLAHKPVEAIFTSDLYRTQETTRILNEKLNVPVYKTQSFRALDMGKFQGSRTSEFLKDPDVKKAFQDYDYAIPGGESIHQLLDRFVNGMEFIRDNYDYGEVVILSHGAAISNVNAFLQREEYKDVDYCVVELQKSEFHVIESGCYE